MKAPVKNFKWASDFLGACVLNFLERLLLRSLVLHRKHKYLPTGVDAVDEDIRLIMGRAKVKDDYVR